LRLWLGRVTSRLPKMLILTPVMTADLSIQHFLARFRDLAREAKLFVAPSPAAAEALMANGVPASGIRVVRHGIPLMKRRPLPLETASGPLRFIYVGRINHVKGVHVLIEAMRMFGTAERHELHVYGAATTRGEKRYESRLKRRSALLPVKWHGSIPPSEIEEALGMADVMVHPTICLEIFGLTIAEAHSVGRPVIATRCGGAEFQIRDGIDGRLVPPNDARALHRAMTEVVSLPQLPIQWASQIQAPHSIHEHVEELMDLYSKSAGGFHVD
jgi:glycosyltransferase involved in cell wall biosynthesis